MKKIVGITILSVTMTLVADHAYHFTNHQNQPVIFLLKMTRGCEDRRVYVPANGTALRDQISPFCSWVSVYVYRSDNSGNQREQLAQEIPLAPFMAGDWNFSIDENNNITYT